GERRNRIGSGPFAFAGARITVSSLMPSRTGTITFLYVYAGACARLCATSRTATPPAAIERVVMRNLLLRSLPSPRLSGIPSFNQAVHETGERLQTIVALLRVVVRMRALGVCQVRAVPRRLELMSLVPLVERVDVHEEKSLPRVGERRIRLQPD